MFIFTGFFLHYIQLRIYVGTKESKYLNSNMTNKADSEVIHFEWEGQSYNDTPERSKGNTDMFALKMYENSFICSNCSHALAHHAGEEKQHTVSLPQSNAYLDNGACIISHMCHSEANTDLRPYEQVRWEHLDVSSRLWTVGSTVSLVAAHSLHALTTCSMCLIYIPIYQLCLFKFNWIQLSRSERKTKEEEAGERNIQWDNEHENTYASWDVTISLLFLFQPIAWSLNWNRK